MIRKNMRHFIRGILSYFSKELQNGNSLSCFTLVLCFSASLAMIYLISSTSYRMVLIMINGCNQLFLYLTFWYLIMLMDPHHSFQINVLCFFLSCFELSDLSKVMQLSSNKFGSHFSTFIPPQQSKLSHVC